MKYILLLLAALAFVALATAQDSPQPAPATIVVKLPPEAKLFFGATPVSGTGTTRTFKTPFALEPGRVYSWYTVRAMLERDGETISVTRKVKLKAGEETIVDFGDLRLGTEAGDRPVAAEPDEDPIPGLPRGNPPRLQLIKVDNGVLHIGQVFHKTVPVTAVRKVVKDGKEIDVPYTITKTVQEGWWQPAALPPVVDAAGRPIDPDRLAERVPGEMAALVLDVQGYGDHKIDRVYQAAFTRETLTVFLQMQYGRPAPPGIEPAPAPKQAPSAPTPKGPATFLPEQRDSVYPVVFLGQPPEGEPGQPVRPGETPKGGAKALAPKPMQNKITPPPTVCLAVLDSKGTLRLRQCREGLVMKKVVKEVERDGVRVPTEITIQTNHLNVSTERFDPADYKAYGADGKAITAEDLAQALARERAVLISADRNLPEPIYLKAVRPGVPILVLSRPFAGGYYGGFGGYPVPAPMATPAPTPPPEPIQKKT